MLSGTSRLIPPAAGAIALVAWPYLFSSPFDIRMFTLAGVYALMAIGYQFVFGYAGALALSQATFFGLGAYTTALLATQFGSGFAITFPASIGIAVLLASAIALPLLRLSSHYFALATLGVAQVVALLATEWVSLTGGANGLPGVPVPVVFGLTVPRGWPLMLLTWSIATFGAVLAWQLTRGLYGTVLNVLREDELTARSLGIDTDRIRTAMLLFSAAFGGAAGALFAHTIRIASPEALEFKTMLACVTMVVVGGRTSAWGAIIGAIIVVHLPELLRFFERSYLMLYSGVLLLLLVVAPDGLIGVGRRWLYARPKTDLDALKAVQNEEGAAPEVRGMLLPSPTPILEIKNVGKSFGGVRALDNVSLSLRRGTITAIIGPNGSGKTTLVNCITGVEKPDIGEIRLANNDITGLRPHEIARRGIARTFQNLRLIGELSILDNVAAARYEAERARAKGLEKLLFRARAQTRARAYALNVLHRLGVDDVDRPCASLPYGVKRRVEIARALSLDPLVVLLDEPAAGLNESEQNDLAARLQDLALTGVTLMIIEHNLAFLRTLATYMICLDQGRVIAAGRPSEIYAHPRVMEAYLGTSQPAEAVAE